RSCGRGLLDRDGDGDFARAVAAEEERTGAGLAAGDGDGHGGLSGGNQHLGHDHAVGAVGGDVEQLAALGGGGGQAEGQLGGAAGLQVERAGVDGQRAGVHAEGADRGGAGGAAEGDAVVGTGRHGRDVEGDGVGGFELGAHGSAVEGDDVVLGEAAADDADAGADGAAVGFERENVAVDDAARDDAGVFLAGVQAALVLDGGVDLEVVGELLAVGGQLVVEFVDVAAEGAFAHRVGFAVDDDVDADAAGHDGL